MSYTTDRDDPRLTRGVDTSPVSQAEAYLVLSEDEIMKGFVRPYRDSYRHVGDQPKHPLRELTDEEKERFSRFKYVSYEAYPKSDSAVTGRYWTEEQLANKGCGNITTMGRAIAETYARDPKFYGATYCTCCQMHRPVAEFVWLDGEQVGS